MMSLALESLESRVLLSASLLTDINLDTASSNPAGFAQLSTSAGTFVLFRADDGIHGAELWRTDGTAAGTSLVKDIYPGAGSSTVAGMVALNGLAYFSAYDNVSGLELWRSDGTAAGTTLVADLAPGTPSSGPADLTVMGNTLYFSTASGCLYSLDGSAPNAAPVLVKQFTSSPGGFTAFNGKLFFSASDAASGDELWSTDGTSAGTALVADIAPGTTSSGPVLLTVAGNALYFGANDGTTGNELWKTDGTAAGTVLVADLNPGSANSFPRGLTALGNNLVFAATVPGASGGTVTALCTTDGTIGGTYQLGTFSSTSSPMVAVGTSVYFAANDGVSGSELWKTDGTAAGTQLVDDLSPGSTSSDPRLLTNVNGTLFFVAALGSKGGDLFKTDGTAAGTVDLLGGTGTRTSGYNARSFSQLTAIGNTLYFANSVLATGTELWTSDGTAAGTSLVTDINTTTVGSSPSRGILFNGRLYFAATDDTDGRELWSTDGTSAGTALFKDINPGLGSASPSNFTIVGDTLFFTANDGTTGTELWKTDGTPAGTTLVADINPGSGSSIPGSLINFNGTLYFSAYTPAYGTELWKSDGTAAGTQLVVDIAPGSSSSNLAYLTLFNNDLYFSASDGTAGSELWRSDGTAAGTALVKDIYAGSGSSMPDDFTVVGNTLFFIATAPTLGAELYKTDGTTAGTTLVDDITPGYNYAGPTFLTDLNGKLVFVDNDGINGVELWTSDGTLAGTSMLKDIYPGAAGANPTGLTVLGSVLYFAADDGTHGAELWKSDGSTAGTQLAVDVNPGLDGSLPSSLTAVGSTLYFGGYDAAGDNQLWHSDGTAAGTQAITDAAPGSGYYIYGVLGAIGDTLVFSATDSAHGVEPWTTAMPAPVAPVANAGGPYTVGEGSTLTLSGRDSTGTISTYEWDLNYDPSVGFTTDVTGVTANFTAPDGPATRTIALRTTGPVGTSLDITTINILDVAPSATISGPTSLYEGKPAYYSATVYDPSSTDTAAGFSYAWSVTMNGNVLFTSTASILSFNPPDNGIYNINLTVTDKDGLSSLTSTQLTAINFPPTPLIGIPDSREVEGAPVTFTSTVLDPSPVDAAAGFSYLWTASKYGLTVATGTSSSFTFTPDDSAYYDISLRVTDKDGGVGGETVAYLFANVPPTVAITSGPAGDTAPEGSPVTYTASATDPSSADTTAGFTYYWSVTKNGVAFARVTGASPSFTFTPDDNATYAITVAAGDKDGGISQPITRLLTVTNVAPTGTFAATGPANEGGIGTVAFTNTRDSAVDERAGFTYSYDFNNDGKFDLVTSFPTATVPTSIVGDGPATRIIHARITDKDGASTDYTTTLTVVNVPPIVAIAGPTSVKHHQKATFSFLAGDPSAADMAANFTYYIDWNGDGKIDQVITGSSSITVSTTFRTKGTYHIAVYAVDKDGGAGPLSLVTLNVT